MPKTTLMRATNVWGFRQKEGADGTALPPVSSAENGGKAA